MARIIDYTSPVGKITPSDVGFSAFETAARRISPAYSQAAEDYRRQGQLSAEMIAQLKLLEPAAGSGFRVSVGGGRGRGAADPYGILGNGRFPRLTDPLGGDFGARHMAQTANSVINPQFVQPGQGFDSGPAGIVQRDVAGSPEAAGQMFGGDATSQLPDYQQDPSMQVGADVWSAAASGEGNAPEGGVQDPITASDIADQLNPPDNSGGFLQSLSDAASAAYQWVTGSGAGSSASAPIPEAQ